MIILYLMWEHNITTKSTFHSVARINKMFTLHVKHDHQYRRNFKFLNIIWYIVCFFTAFIETLDFFSRNTSSILHVEYKALWDCLCCVLIEIVNCLNTIILKSFVIIVFTSILHLFYCTNTTQKTLDFFSLKKCVLRSPFHVECKAL
jgi:hypothetical protein